MKYYALIIGVLCFGIWSILAQLFQHSSNDYLSIHALSIGQGDSTLIITPQKKTILVDGGPSTSILYEVGKVLPSNIHTIDMVIISHPHYDHYAGIISIAQRYKIGMVLTHPPAELNESYTTLMSILQYQNIPVVKARAHTDFFIEEGITLDILYPFENTALEKISNINNRSIVAKLQYGQTSILLTGDLEAEGESELLHSEANLHSTILKIGHHGSRSSSTIPFIHAVRPQLAYMQYGVGNRYEHPHPETLQTFQNTPLFSSSVETFSLYCDNKKACGPHPDELLHLSDLQYTGTRNHIALHEINRGYQKLFGTLRNSQTAVTQNYPKLSALFGTISPIR